MEAASEYKIALLKMLIRNWSKRYLVKLQALLRNILDDLRFFDLSLGHILQFLQEFDDVGVHLVYQWF